MNHQALRLTPSNSPFFKNNSPRSPTKPRGDEAGLRLKKIIGTTTAGANGFACLPSKRQFAYCAGSAAVVATVDEELNVTQRFFRARPTASAGARDGIGAFPASPTPNEARSRALGHVRDHTIGGSPLGVSSRDWSDSPSGKTATAKDRVKAATSVALSPNGKWVALGETGYKPRVLVFSNSGDSTESPACALAEHTFGVQALSFSPDSRYLASLGTVNDGFLYLWNVDDRTGAASLHSSNKCTVVINDMAWVGKSLITVGLRFIKIWRPTEDCTNETRTSDSTISFGTPKSKNLDFGNSILSPKQKVLSGKNTLLGDLLDCTFVCVVPLDNDNAVICSESGEIAILDDISRTQSLRPVAFVDFPITAACTDNRGWLYVSGICGHSRSFDLRELEHCPPVSAKRDRRQSISPTKRTSFQTPAVIATAAIDDLVLEMDSRRNIRLTRSTVNAEKATPAASHQLSAHNDSVVGVQALASHMFPDAAFLTFAGNGVLRLWNGDGSSASASLTIPVESSADMYDQTNELRAAAAMATSAGEYIVAGDRYGTLTMLDWRTGAVTTQVRAHSAEISDVVAFERSGVRLVATCSRDRTIQVFAWIDGQLDLIQTLDEHAAAVNGLLTMSDGEKLLSYSQDRTVIVREAMLRQESDPSSLVFVMTRSIALKSSPTCICPAATDDEIFVSAMDRCIGLYNISTGQAGFTFKASDSDGGEAVAMSKIAYEPSLNGNPAIIGISGSDKSVRLYSEYGTLLARDWGHTEGITDLAVLHSNQKSEKDYSESVHVVTVAADSTIFVWDTLPPLPTSFDNTQDTNGHLATPSTTTTNPLRPPLRKVLSFSELSRFKRDKSSTTSTDDPVESPTAMTPRQQSPHRLRKKPSKISMSQAPKLEPAFRAGATDREMRRRSLRKRSPSPPSPRTRRDAPAGPTSMALGRKPSLAARSKSSENVLHVTAAGGSGGVSSTAEKGARLKNLTAEAEGVVASLRAFRGKVATSSSSSLATTSSASASGLDGISAEILAELDTEVWLLKDLLDEKLGRSAAPDGRAAAVSGGAMSMERVLEEASERIVSRLDERIRERVEGKLRRSGGSSTGGVGGKLSRTDGGGEKNDVGGGGYDGLEAVAGAMDKVNLAER